ncbi:MAG: DUF4079 domain-containing protein [Cyanobacteria bacterium P01_C01_bin.72]
MSIRSSLEPIANWFSSLGTPEPIVHWGHPLMMGIVVFVMGSAAALAGWRGRTLAATNMEVAIKNKADHRQIAPLMYVFLVSGYTGGVLSLVMQGQPILESPHFITGTVVISLLTINALIAATGFIGNQETARTVHAYVGSAALLILVAHALLGLNLGLSI